MLAALLLAFAPPRVAVLPPVWDLPKVTTISGPPKTTPVERPLPELVEKAIGKLAKERYDLVPEDAITKALEEAGPLRVDKPEALATLRTKLGADILVLPVLVSYTAFRNRPTTRFRSPQERDRDARNRDRRGEEVPWLDNATESGFNASARALVVTEKGSHATKVVSNEVKDDSMSQKSERTNADKLAAKLLDAAIPRERRP